MTGEIPGPSEIDSGQNTGLSDVQSSANPDQPRPATPHSFIRIPDILGRGRIREEKEAEADARFDKDVGFVRKLSRISKTISNTPISGSVPGEFQDPDKLLEAYKEGTDDTKKGLRSAIKNYTEHRQRTVMDTLKRDLFLLYQDQGLSTDEVEKKLEDLTTASVNGKKKQIKQLPKESQIGILENMAELRQQNLVKNFEEYMYFLSFSSPNPITESEAHSATARRESFTAAGDEEKASIAAETRKMAEEGLGKTFDANVPRLEKIELMAGYRMPLIKRELSDLRKLFQVSTLAKKVQIVDEMQKRKLTLSRSYLMGIVRLRRILSGITGFPEEDNSGDITVEQRLQEEVEKILPMARALAFNTKKHTSATTDVELGETLDTIKGIALTQEDPSLIDAYKLVLLLRMAPQDFFKL